MVVGPKAEFSDKTGSSRGISNDLDRLLIGKLRAVSDVAVTGGNTARIEQYKTPKNAKLAVITRSNAVYEGWIRLNPPNSSKLPEWVIETLNSMGFTAILLEVGPSLARQFLAHNLVDEFCLTIPSGDLDVANRVMNDLDAKLLLAESQTVANTLFTIWRRGNDSGD